MIKGGKLSALFGTALFAFGLTTIAAVAQDYSDIKSYGPLFLREYGSFFIPGNLAACPTPPPPATNSNMCSGTTNPGLHMINQMYVQFMKPLHEEGKRDSQIRTVHEYPIGIVLLRILLTGDRSGKSTANALPS